MAAAWWHFKQSPSGPAPAPSTAKHASIPTATDLPLITVKPTSNDILSPASPIADVLARTEGQGLAILSNDAVYRQAVDAAANSTGLQMPKFEKPKSKRGRVKSRLRRMLLPKWVLRMVLGKTVAGWVYPWIHPKK